MSPAIHLRRLGFAAGFGLLIILTAPFLRQIRDAVAAALAGRFVRGMEIAFTVAVAAALVLALLRIRRRRWLRYGGLALASSLVLLQVVAFRTGNPDVDAVERIHMIQYGLLAFLCYRTYLDRRDLSLPLASILSPGLVGILDEWLQWFVPVRTGDFRDVFLNLYAALCGTLFAFAVVPPWRFSWRLPAASGRRVLTLGATGVLLFGLFFHSAHLGYEIVDEEIGRFVSFFTAEELLELQEKRAREWAENPPTRLETLAKEDYFLTEAASHVLHRNASYHRGDAYSAWNENRILEKYYEPFLDVHSFHGKKQHRFSPEERERIRQSAAWNPEPYRSPVLTDRIFVRPGKSVFWTLVLVGALLLAGGAVALGREKKVWQR